MKKLTLCLKILVLSFCAAVGFTTFANASEITNASKYVGQVKFVGGANRVFTGSGFLVDQASFSSATNHQCNFSGRVAMVTANHVLHGKAVGETVDLSFPYHEFDELYQPTVKPTIVVRDIVSDLAVANLSQADRAKLRNLKSAARPLCVGLAGRDISSGMRAHLMGFETGSYLSTSTQASLRSVISKNSVDLKNSRVLAFDNVNWLTLDGYASPGMSGGIAATSSKTSVGAVMLKKLPDSSAKSKPVTLAVPVSKVRAELSKLWRDGKDARQGQYKFSYIPATEEIEFVKDELRFRELTRRKSFQFKLQLAGDPHDISGGYAKAAEIMNVSQDHSGLMRYLDTRGSAIIISRMAPGTRYYDDYRRFMGERSNYVLVVQAAQGESINSMVDLMKVIEGMAGHEKLRLTIAIKSLDGRKGLMEIGDGPRESVSKLNLQVSAVLEKYGQPKTPREGRELDELERIHGLAADLMNAVIDSELDKARSQAIESTILELVEMAEDEQFGSREHTHREAIIGVKREIRKVQDHFQVFSNRGAHRPAATRTQIQDEDDW